MDTDEQYIHAWEMFDVNIINVICTNTLPCELSFRLVTKLFNFNNNTYTCSYTCNLNKQHLITINNKMVSKEDIEGCKFSENVQYGKLKSLPEHTISLFFLYSLGLQK